MLEFKEVYKRYPEFGEALHDVSFHIGRGERVFLTGHSGAGKSTLLKLVAVIERATRGQIVLDGRNITRASNREIPYIRRKLGLIFQDYKLLYDRSVFDNVALPLVIAGFNPGEVSRRVRAALGKVGLLSKEKRLPQTLSGGEQQRVGIARAIVHKPDFILADEPTGNLDPEAAREVMDIFRDFNDLGVTLLIASHDEQLISRCGGRVLRLQRGSLSEVGA
ncbi:MULTISPECIES: cell division ATP-binding protein FtsE [Methylococcus]|uniref:Cell division ATP-binding protein FtsE n=2 Tax=Methylococcus capsulatus TaxID=414 RepID=Q60CH2_METCA|nr:cell division ATP-binding protein FtsE [Methylococcus capsulatus]AAU90642.1 cell division ATP-binding protein FtsE [Methylococcus capsulatus str. Bath]QXP86371.1 cell division ATP-binding protein FtsE [Methylococcus capsulatus]QXP89411.1 cell division ATP-binding protein FtsE [Methylococcus capsulatus]QXP93960.1 cell division ATP-binding protein FtsE [Methylococcus capsulatus]UQN11313.1 cell division ATP-binding protein FtsE [Methylococcus capsulatus]